MGWDKKRFGGYEGGSKEIESIDDVLFIHACRRKCGGTDCGECGVQLYGGNCNRVDEKVRAWLVELYGLDDEHLKKITNEKNGVEAQAEAYRSIFEDPLWTPPKNPAHKANVSRCDGTCSTCRFSESHSSGIRFCKSFGNFTHDDGHCYRYEEVESDV